MKHLIHILIISAILLGLAFCFGCKEKAEAAEPNDTIILQGKRHAWQEEGWNRIEFTPEPNELCKHENRITCSVYGCGCWSCMDCNESWEPNELLIESSNEPYIYPSPMEYEPFTCITQLIPTWPNYIELEKDLWFDMKTVLDPNTTVLYEKIGFPKGTKIYFKD